MGDPLSQWLLSEVLVDDALYQQDDESKHSEGKGDYEDAGMPQEAGHSNLHEEGEEKGQSHGDPSS